MWCTKLVINCTCDRSRNPVRGGGGWGIHEHTWSSAITQSFALLARHHSEHIWMEFIPLWC